MTLSSFLTSEIKLSINQIFINKFTKERKLFISGEELDIVSGGIQFF